MYMIFFFALARRWWVWRRQTNDDPMVEGMPRFALVIMFVFLLTEYRIEFLRFVINDYQQYIFALWAMMLAFTGIKQKPALQADDSDLRMGQSNVEQAGRKKVLRLRRVPPV